MLFRSESAEFFLIRSDQNDRNRLESDLKNWPYLCHSVWKKFRANSDQIRVIPSGSAQIRWVTGKTSLVNVVNGLPVYM